ncbi:MAG: ATP-dependent DNA helicase RecG, partial [Patescibacteria group bacterium]
MNLNTRIPEVNFYLKRIAKKLEKLEIKTVNNLLFYYPFRYEDFSAIKKIKDLAPGDIATVKVKVELIKNYRSPQKHKKITEAIMSDGSGKIKVLWFNQWYITNNIAPGDELYLVAKISDSGYAKEIINPEYEKVSDKTTHTARIVPIYPLTAGISQKQIRTAVKLVLEYASALEDYLPQEIIAKNSLISLSEAILNIHFPASNELKDKAIKRLSFDELFFNQLNSFWLKKDLEKKKAKNLPMQSEKLAEFTSDLPFKLTNAQRKAAMEILKDMDRPRPMNRLLNGDVGSGKTLVAALAIYNTVLSGGQSALLAPTEILARQHYNTLAKLFANLNVKIGLITRGQKIINYTSVIPDPELSEEYSGIQKNNGRTPDHHSTKATRGGQVRDDIKEIQDNTKKKLSAQSIAKNSDIIIGTHALLQEKIKFTRLALAVVDEQHRFGVEQRAKLSSMESEEGLFPHLLSMTATPIPRTMAIVMYGDLELSILDEMPHGRKEIKTYVVRPEKRDGAYDFIQKEIKSGRQAFVICPLIDESDKLGVKSVTKEYERLKNEIFPEFKISFLHGKLKSDEKDAVMNGFKENKINILVSTSVIEVGVDIPNATIMMIEGAERFGFAQLHQFRGRVGRGEHQSYCLLFPTEGEATKRLLALEKINDGFRLAEIDLELRGPGQVYGKEQSG